MFKTTNSEEVNKNVLRSNSSNRMLKNESLRLDSIRLSGQKNTSGIGWKIKKVVRKIWKKSRLTKKSDNKRLVENYVIKWKRL